MEKINVNDEASFTFSCEQFIYDLQKTFRRVQPELMDCPLIEMCLQIENFIYQKALEESGMASTANVWTSGQAIMYYQELRGKVLKNLEFKSNTNWRKLYDENRANPQKVIAELMKEEDDRKLSRGLQKSSTSTGALKPMRRVKTPGQVKLKPPKKLKGANALNVSSNPSKISNSTAFISQTNNIINSSNNNSNNNFIVPKNDLNASSNQFDVNMDNFPDSMLAGMDMDDGDFNLGIFEGEEHSSLPEIIIWKTSEDGSMGSSNNNNSNSSSSSHNNREQPSFSSSSSSSITKVEGDNNTGTSIWKMAQEETSNRQRHEEIVRRQQQELLKKTHQHVPIAQLANNDVNKVIDSQISEADQSKEKLNYEREMERKRREAEESQLRENTDNLLDDDDNDWLD